MKKVISDAKLLLLVSCWLALLLYFQPVAGASDEVFTDDFDDGDISDWTITTTGVGVFEVSTDVYFTLPYSVHMKSLTDSQAMGVSPTYTLDLSRDYNVSMRFLLPHSDNHWFEVFNNHQIYLIVDYGSDLKCYDGSSVQSIMTLETDEWYLIEINAHPSLNSYDVHVNSAFKETCPMWIHSGLESSFRIGDRADGSTDRGEAYWDNICIYQQANKHDIAVLNVTFNKTIVCQGYYVNISVTVENQGDSTETFNMTIYGNSSVSMMQYEYSEGLASGESVTIIFSWNTSSFAKGNYSISANVEPVFGELDTEDNSFTDGWIVVAMVGDLTGPDGWPDGKCDIRDVAVVAKLFGVNYPDPDYEPNYDIIYDLKIDIKDIATVAKHFGEIDP
ncbi:MAG: hypothetical protein AM326_05015 [Candidatus Thorarchaeota archaeon SMTZ-45]|nr:MAG: hypothetical protein AM326_05015 [Candidatus Thorarchaeota archaeon SMTZ-45]